LFHVFKTRAIRERVDRNAEAAFAVRIAPLPLAKIFFTQWAEAELIAVFLAVT
jgi:hypothetical protein